MRILVIGFIVLAGWTTLSTYIYVCKIKGLCNKPQTTLVAEANPDSNKSTTPLGSEEVTIPSDLVIYFAFDKSDYISGEDASKYFNESTAYLNQHAQSKLIITGHADAVGSNAYNQLLGYRRAQTMQKYFVSKGLAGNRISIESKGENEPVADNKSDEGRAKNRRSVVTLKK